MVTVTCAIMPPAHDRGDRSPHRGAARRCRWWRAAQRSPLWPRPARRGRSSRPRRPGPPPFPTAPPPAPGASPRRPTCSCPVLPRLRDSTPYAWRKCAVNRRAGAISARRRSGRRVQLHFRHADLTAHAETPPDRYKKYDTGAVSFVASQAAIRRLRLSEDEKFDERAITKIAGRRYASERRVNGRAGGYDNRPAASHQPGRSARSRAAAAATVSGAAKRAKQVAPLPLMRAMSAPSSAARRSSTSPIAGTSATAAAVRSLRRAARSAARPAASSGMAKRAGAERCRERGEIRLGGIEPPQRGERLQGGGGIARAGADARGDRQVLDQRQRRRGWAFGLRGEALGGAPDEIVARRVAERGGVRAAHRQRQSRRRLGDDLVRRLGESDEAVKHVIAVGAAAHDMQIKIELRRSGPALSHQPPRVDDPEGGLTGPRSSLVSMVLTSSASGLNCSARRHWKRASATRPDCQ